MEALVRSCVDGERVDALLEELEGFGIETIDDLRCAIVKRASENCKQALDGAPPCYLNQLLLSHKSSMSCINAPTLISILQKASNQPNRLASLFCEQWNPRDSSKVQAKFEAFGISTSPELLDAIVIDPSLTRNTRSIIPRNCRLCRLNQQISQHARASMKPKYMTEKSLAALEFSIHRSRLALSKPDLRPIVVTAPHNICLQRDGQSNHKPESYTTAIAHRMAASVAGGHLTWARAEQHRVEGLCAVGRWEGIDSTPDPHNRDPNYMRTTELCCTKNAWYKALEELLGACRVIRNRHARRAELGRSECKDSDQAGERDGSEEGVLSFSSSYFSERKEQEEMGRVEESNWCLHIDVHGCRNPPAYNTHLIVGMGAMRNQYLVETKRRKKAQDGQESEASEESKLTAGGNSGNSGNSAKGGSNNAKGKCSTKGGEEETLFGYSIHPGELESALSDFENALKQELTEALTPLQNQLERAGKESADAALVATDLPVLIGCWPAQERRCTSTQQSLRLGYTHAVQLEFSLVLREILFREPTACSAVATAIQRACERAPMAI
jgi:hypothetical protein